jgi:uncharacterized protein YacL
MFILTVVRSVIVILSGVSGYFIARVFAETPAWHLIGSLLGFLFALLLILIERSFTQLPAKMVVGGLVGGLAGLLTGNLLTFSLLTFSLQLPFDAALRAIVKLSLVYLGIIIGVQKGQRLSLGEIKRAWRTEESENYKILDTSVIIDGRIADISDTGFLEGTLIVPSFILAELQHIADSGDPIKRNRGRRGLDILNRLQKKLGSRVRIEEQDFSRIKKVDDKLIALSKVWNAAVITNDFNLNKVAQLHGVQVLNVNDLSNAIKPVVIPGEGMVVTILKEGKEANQGVGYLDDGTMVVVDDARQYIGKTVDAVVTSVLQTTAGRLIFTRLRDEGTAAQEGV